MSEVSPFECPQCAAVYRVVRVEAEPADDRAITCPVCDAPLRGRDGRFILKYFLVGQARHARPRAAPAPLRA